jgi:tetratricopeptide (TPR) repeat protein
MRKRVLAAVVLATALAACAPFALAVYRAQSGLGDAQELMAHQLWPRARERLAAYLWLHPGDAQARMLMAEALAKDEALAPEDAARESVSCLTQIPDSSPHAGDARLQQGRLTFLILQEPARAEQFLRRAVELDTGLPAWQLLWTLLCVTGRAEESEEAFWRVYELSSDDQRPLRLREWYLNQFFPITANESLDRMMGILGPQETPTRMTESRRYLRFREKEPDAPLNHAAVAQWCQEEGDPQFARRVLDAAAKALPAAQWDRLFVAVSVATHLDLGQFDEAQALVRDWPEGARGHAYWKSKALVLEDVQGRHEEALAAYDRALALWPGPADWRLHHRRAGCLARLRRPGETAAAKERAARVQALMAAENHERLREALASLDDPAKLAEVIDFYRQLGRDREAEAWQRHAARVAARGKETR